MRSQYRYIIFDLDGTLVKSEEGLFDSITYALTSMGVDPGERKDMRRMIGPVLWESFRKFYHLSAEDADKANALFTEAYENEGLYNVSVYGGVEEMLRALQDAGKKLLVVTAKPRNMAEIVLDHTGLSRYFQTIIGPDKSEKKTDKAFLLRKALVSMAESDEEHYNKSNVIMVGDRKFDVEGAGEVDIRSIGVLYGYGDRNELVGAGATYIAETPAEVVGIICGEPQQRRMKCFQRKS